MNIQSESLSARIVALVLCLALAFPAPVWANDKAGTPNVVHGGASINRDGDNLTVVTNTDRTIINWDRFGVPGGSTTHFAQPGVGSATLNRVQGSLPTHINGTLSSNGAVFVTNAHGVVVGANGVVRTDGGFVASSLNISDADFIGGGPNGTAAMRFSHGGYGAGGVENHGVIESAHGDVFLIGNRVANTGRVAAANGTAGFAAGSEVVIHPLGRADGRIEVVATEASFAGGTGVDNSGVVNAASAELRAHGDLYKLAVNNTGIIEARGVERTPDGRVFLSAGGRGGKAAGNVVNAGSIRAVNADGSGGSAYVTGENITLASGSGIDVSAERGDGGVALIGGGFQGAGSYMRDADTEVIVPSATSVTMEAGAAITADAAGAGDGGLAVLWSEGATTFDGNISARGGELGGDGGLVETSGHKLYVYGLVDTRAEAGQTGMYLLDPYNFTISSGGAALSDSGIGAGTLTDNLATTNMFLHTDGAAGGAAGTDAGNITVNAAVTWDSANSLTLAAHNDITVNANIQNAGSGAVTLVAGWDPTATDASDMVTGGVFNTAKIPANFAAMQSAKWFGDVAGAGTGSVKISNASVGSRMGQTLVFAKDVEVGSASTWGRIGYVVPGSAVEADYTASGDIGVYAKGNVSLTGGADGGAQIGHTWTGRTDSGTTYYALKADNADIAVMAGGAVSLTGGTAATSRFSQIGHGGSTFSASGSISSLVQAKDSAITVTSGGAAGVKLSAGSSRNAYARIGHSGASYVYEGSGTLSSQVVADGSSVTVEATGGDVVLTAGANDKAHAQIGHGAALFHNGSGTISGSVTADNAGVTVEAKGNVALTGSSTNTAYTQIGHGGGVYSISGIGGSEAYLVQAKDSAIRVSSGGMAGVALTVGSGENAYARIGHGGANYVQTGSGTLSSQVVADGSSVTVEATGGDVVLKAGDAQNAHAQIGHGAALLNGGSGTISGSVTADKADVTVEAEGNVEMTASSKYNAYTQIGHGGGVYSYSGGFFGIGSSGASLVQAKDSAITVTSEGTAGVALTAGSLTNAYAHIGHGGANSVLVGRGALSSQVVVDASDGSSVTVKATGGDVVLTAGSAINAHAQIGHSGANNVAKGSGTLSSQVVANDSSITVEATGGDVVLKVGDSANAQIGHGAALFNGGTGTISGSVTADNADVTVEATGNVELTALSDTSSAYTQIGHGGRVSSLSGSIGGSGAYLVQAKDSDITVTSGGTAGVALTAGSRSNAYARIGHGGANYVETGSGTLSSQVVADGSSVTVNATGGDVVLKAGKAYNAHAQIGHGTALYHGGDGTISGSVTADKADVTVEAKGNVALTASSGINAYARIGHGGANYVQTGSGTISSQVVADGSSVIVKATDGDVVLTAGASLNAHAQIGHGAALFHFENGAISGSVTADNADVTVEAKGKVALAASSFTNAYTQIGHGGANYLPSGSGALSSPVVANNSSVTVATDGDVVLEAGTGHNAHAHIGHGAALFHGGSGTISGSVTADNADVTVEAEGNVEMTASSGVNAYTQIGHGGGVYGNPGSIGGSSKDSAIKVTSGGADGVALTAGDHSNAYARIGHGGANSVGSDSGTFSSQVDADRSGVTVKATGGDVVLTAGTGDNATAQIGHGAALYNGGDGTISGSVTADNATVTVEAEGKVALTASTYYNAYTQIGHGGGVYSYSGGISGIDGSEAYLVQAKDSAITVTSGDMTGVALTAGDHWDAYARIGHGGANYVESGSGTLSSQVVADGSSVTVKTTGGDVVLKAAAGSNAHAQIGHGTALGHGGDGTISGSVTADNATVTVEATGSVAMTASPYINAYTQIGHGGGIYGFGAKSVSWTAAGSTATGGGADIVVITKTLSLTGDYAQAIVGNIIQNNDSLNQAWIRPDSADPSKADTMLIRLTDTSTATPLTNTEDSTAIIHGGSGSFSLIADGALDMTNNNPVRLATHTGEANFVAGGDLAVGGLSTNGSVNLLAGWKSNAGWTNGPPPSFDIGAAMAATAAIDQGKKLTLGTLSVNGNLHARAGTIVLNAAILNGNHGDFSLFRAEKSMTWNSGSSYVSAKDGHQLILDLTKLHPNNDPANSFTNRSSKGGNVFGLSDSGARWLIWGETDLDVSGGLGGLDKSNRQFRTAAPNRNHTASGWGIAVPAIAYAGSGFVFTDKAPTITVNAPGNLTYTYGDSPDLSALTPSDWSTLVDSTSRFILGDTVAEVITSPKITTNADSETDVGTSGLYVKVDYDGAFGYTFNTNSGGVVVNRRIVNVAATPGQTGVYGDPLSAIAYSGSLVNGDSFAGALGLDGTPNTNGRYDAGSYSITRGTLDAGDNYILVFAPGETYTVAPRAVSVVSTGSGNVYGDALTLGHSDSQLLSGDSFTGSLGLDGSVNSNGRYNAGSYAILLGTLSAGGNYTLSVADGSSYVVTPRTINVTADSGKTSIYGDPMANLSYAHDALVDSDSLFGSLALGGSVNANGRYDAGTYAILQGDLSAGGNYTIVYTGDTYTVTRRALAVAPDAGQGSVYGESLSSIGYAASGLLSGDSLTGALGIDGLVNGSGWYDAGAYAITAGTLGNANYDVAVAAGSTYTVSKRSITVAGYTGSRQYGDANPSAFYTVGGSGLAAGDSLAGSANVAGNPDAATGVGSYAITQGSLTNANNTNYDIAWANGQLIITKRAITVTADEASRMMGRPNPDFTWKLTDGSLVNGDSLHISLDSLADVNSPVGLYDILLAAFSVSGIGDGNYELTFVGDNRLTVTALPAENGNNLEVYLPSSPSVPGGAPAPAPDLSSTLMPPTDRPAFADMVNVPGLSPLKPPSPSLAQLLAGGWAFGETDAALLQSFVITHEIWKALYPLETADAIAVPGDASAWRTAPLVSENASRNALGITLDEAHSLFISRLVRNAPGDWEFRAEHVDTDETDEEGNPIKAIRVVMTKRR